MEETTLRENIARNLSFYRREAGHTQSELAELLSYSDKSISKWERAEGVPDIYVLQRIAELYHITVSDLLADAPRPARKKLHTLVFLLSTGLVWLVATVVFFILVLSAPALRGKWLCFIYAIPVCGILSTVFAGLWCSNAVRCAAVSLLVWGCAISLHLTCLVNGPLPGFYIIYIVAGVLQVLFILWFILRHHVKGSGKPKRAKAQ